MNDTRETGGLNKNLTTLKGVLIPVDWDDDGGITAVALSTSDEKKYLVVKDEKGDQLIPLVREELELAGVVKTTENKLTITVVNYHKKSDWNQSDHQ